jgi:methanogenic corrinoid protein MtbC1
VKQRKDMTYIRTKKVKGIDYLYLVKSSWDAMRKTSIQKTVKYLGKASDINIEDLPVEYRNNSKILSSMTSKVKDETEKSLINEETRNQVLEFLKNGETEKILKLEKRIEQQSTIVEFYDKILKSVLYKIGDLWSQDKLDVATEHVCSNIANEVIHKINKNHPKNAKKPAILICTPEGEIHNIGCNIIESILIRRGYKVYNISPSMPSESIIKYIKDTKPSMILVSVTLKDNIGSAKRLVKKIGTQYGRPILLGGLALQHIPEKEKTDIEAMSPTVKIIINASLEKIYQAVREISKNITLTEINDPVKFSRL